MGWVLMSERELKRVEVLAQVLDGALEVDSAAGILGLTRRQVFRLLKAYRNGGASALRHQARGRPLNNRLSDARRDFAMSVIREHYHDFGPTLAAEMLAAHHDLKVSHETLRQWMIAAGIWVPRKQRRRIQQPRLRRESFGELIQIDGSQHRWFEDRAEPCTLLVFIDDATSTLMALKFVPSESTFSYFAALQQYLEAHGRPVAFVTGSVKLTPNRQAKHGDGLTQFGRALAELNIEILCANTSAAKGRVERANRTLQDRLVKALRLAGVSDLEAGNAFLPGFMSDFNAQFSKQPAQSDNLHRPLNTPPDRLADILCWREKRYVGRQLTVSYERKRIIIAETELTRSLVGKDVDTYAFPDGRFEVRWKGHSLDFTVFDKDQRVTQADVVENKRLGAVLAHIKAHQENHPQKPKVKTSREKSGYRTKRREITKDKKTICDASRDLRHPIIEV